MDTDLTAPKNRTQRAPESPGRGEDWLEPRTLGARAGRAGAHRLRPTGPALQQPLQAPSLATGHSRLGLSLPPCSAHALPSTFPEDSPQREDKVPSRGKTPGATSCTSYQGL